MIYIILPVYCLSMINDGFDRYVFLIPLRLISPPSTTNISVSNTPIECTTTNINIVTLYPKNVFMVCGIWVGDCETHCCVSSKQEREIQWCQWPGTASKQATNEGDGLPWPPQQPPPPPWHQHNCTDRYGDSTAIWNVSPWWMHDTGTNQGNLHVRATILHHIAVVVIIIIVWSV